MTSGYCIPLQKQASPRTDPVGVSPLPSALARLPQGQFPQRHPRWKRRLGHLELVFLVYLALFSSDFPLLFIRTAQAFSVCSVAIPTNFALSFCLGLYPMHLLWLLGRASWQLWKDHTLGHCLNPPGHTGILLQERRVEFSRVFGSLGAPESHQGSLG